MNQRRGIFEPTYTQIAFWIGTFILPFLPLILLALISPA